MADYASASFYYPPAIAYLPNSTNSSYPEYDLYDAINVSWTSNFPNLGIYLVLWCSYNKITTSLYNVDAVPSSVPSTVLPNAAHTVNLTKALGPAADSCSWHFQLTLTGSAGLHNNSGDFNIKKDTGGRPTTWALTIPTSSSLPTNTAKPATLSTNTAKPAISSTNTLVPSSSTPSSNTGTRLSSHHSLSTASIAGIAVGVLLSVGGLLILSSLVWGRLRKEKAVSEKAHMEATGPVERDDTNEVARDYVPSELLGTGRDPELDGIPVNELYGSEAVE